MLYLQDYPLMFECKCIGDCCYHIVAIEVKDNAIEMSF